VFHFEFSALRLLMFMACFSLFFDAGVERIYDGLILFWHIQGDALGD
jgi:hypothetical protein